MNRHTCENLAVLNSGKIFCVGNSGYKNNVVNNPIENPNCNSCKNWKPILSNYKIKKYGHNP